MQDFLAQAKDIANKDKREILMITTRASVNGAVTGLVLGLMIGYWKNKNIYVAGLVGAVIGGVATSIIVNKK
jgi:outer membrane lipoprotein SlyB